MIRFFAVFLSILFFTTILSAQPTQTVRGTVTDLASGKPVAAAFVVLRNAGFSESTIADSTGSFTIRHILVGRYDVHISCAGYEPSVIREVLAGSAKEIFLSAELKQKPALLNEIIITPAADKQKPFNTGAAISARTLSVEEAKRYAGGFDDPARLVAAFAGVSSNAGNNAIIVRGNNPQSLQWKMEGIEIPSPNHLGDMRVFGGGGVTALSTQLLARSDFYSGAMPATYSNALSGVFDIFMRKGNDQQREHTFQLGVVGIDVASEGPFKKGGKSSYLFNYRYSTLALVAPLLAENAGGIRYQDLSFKLNFPTKKAGTFSVWGMGLRDRMSADAKRDISKWAYDDDRENHDIRLYMGVAGISHSLHFNDRQYLKSTLAATLNGIHYPTERMDSNLNTTPKNLLNNRYYNLVLSSFLNTKFNAQHTNKTGLTVTNMNYDLHLKNTARPDGPLQDIVKENGNSTLISAYTSSTFHFNSKITVNAGINAQYFTLNNTYSIEPRASIKYRLTQKQSLGFAYGLHSRLERLNYYFIKNSSGENINKDLGFTKAHHWVLSYDIRTSEFTHLKIEAYYQHLFNVPVIADSSFSLLNQQNDWFFNAPLHNDGTGRNYGIDITFEKYFSKGYYYMATASVFNSRYKGGDNTWRDTRYNRNYAFNFLIGKEWFPGKNRQNVLGVNTRLSYQGGDRYTPVNTAQSLAAQSVVFDERNAFSQQYPAAFTSHLTVSYKMNKKNVSHEITLKIINVTQYEEYIGHRYNYQTNQVDVNREPSVIPNLSYRIDF